MAEHQDIYATLVRFFEGEKWKFQASTEERAVSVVFDGKAGPWTTHVKAFDDERQVAVYGVLPFTLEEEKRAAAAELITRINFGLVIGNFEMDFADGEVRYKTSLDFEGDRLSDILLLQLVRANLTIVDSYLPAFVALAAKAITPSDALALVE
ncbi:MAG TPA: YbjN domain-containing protein [Kofleriaceae bacterium]|jgi:hypothetical protein|nr:YbjN domain-containing protein [Kofleriaceae bacterium]